MNKQAEHKQTEKQPHKFKYFNQAQPDEVFPQGARLDEEVFKAAATVAEQPAAATPSMILSLQSTIGNHDVQRLIANKQLPTSQADHTPQVTKTSTAKPALQRDETEEEAEETADEDLDALLERIGIHADPPDVPGYEAITGTTAGEYSAGELEGEIGRLWQHQELSFTEAARAAASGNTSAEHGPVATSSPEIAPEAEYTHRWAVNLLAHDYAPGHHDVDLSDILRRGSPYQRALHEEFERVIPVENPTAAQMYSSVFDAIMALSLTLESDQTAELIVTFSGHGVNGSLTGVDWNDMSVAQLESLAHVAQDFRVHIVYIVDTCRAGILASFAQSSVADHLEEEAGSLPEDRQAQIQQQLAIADHLGGISARISGYTIFVGDMLRYNVRDGSIATDHFQDYLGHLNQIMDQLQLLREYLDSETMTAEGAPDTAALRAHLEPALLAAISAMGGERPVGRRLLRQMAELLDAGNDVINAVLTNAHASESSTASTASSSEAAPTP